jgi:flagellar basal-body rod protein FlgB
MSDLFSDLTMTSLVKSMDGLSMRHKVIANNIANVNTPGFIRSEVSFSDEMKKALSMNDTNSSLRQINDINIESQLDNKSPARSDGNNVSIDKEMTDMSKNTLEYETLTRLLNMKFSLLQTAISEGKK